MLDKDNLYVCLVPASSVKVFIEENHYSRSINGVKISYCFALFRDEVLVGAALFGQLSTTAWKRFGEKESDVLELRRLVLDEDQPRNSETWFLSRCIKYLKANTDVKLLVSYADPTYDHIGYVYQAANWVYCGRSSSDKGYRSPNGKIYHSRALRTKYKGEFKPFVKVLRQQLEDGLLEPITLQGKYTYTYNLRGKNKHTMEYPKK